MGDIKESALNQSSSYEWIRGLDANNNSVRVKKSDLLASIPFSGSETKNGVGNKIGWIRIAVGGHNNTISGGIINIGNHYNNSVPTSVCFYFSGSGYATRNVVTIAKSGGIFTKARILYVATPYKVLYLDIYYNTSASNDLIVSLSSSMQTRLCDLEYVDATLPDGYSVQEFTF